MKRAILLILIIILPQVAFGLDTALIADIVEQTGDIYVADGKVSIQKGDFAITAGHAVYNAATGEASLSGNVQITSPLFEFKAEGAEFNIQTETGALYNATVFVKQENYRFKSQKILKEQGLNFVLEGASVTTCDSPVPEWCISGRRIKIAYGKDAKGRGVSFRVKDVPIIYTPFLWVPILTERTSGLLLPTVGFNDARGFYWQQPLYIVLSENRDATIYLSYFAKRGIGTALEYRFLERIAESTDGKVYIFHIRDTKLKEDFYELKGQSSLSAPDYSARLKLDYVNQSRFITEYKTDLGERTQRFLSSEFQAEERFKGSRLYLGAEHLIDLRPGVEQSTVIQRLPELGYISYPQGLGRFSASYTAVLTNFTRSEGIDGQRLNLALRLGHTAGKGITFFQSASFNEAFYRLYETPDSADDRASRYSVSYNAALESRLIGRYKTVTHTLSPSLSYSYRKQGGDETPLFDSTELRPPSSVFELALMNRLFDQKGEFMTFKASEEIDSDGHNLARFALMIKRPLTVRGLTLYDLNGNSFGDSSIDIEVKDKKTSALLGMQYSKSSNVMLYSLKATHQYSKALLLGAGIWYDTEQGELTNLTADLGWRAQCWGTKVSFVKRPGDWSVFLTLELKGLGSFGSSESATL